MKCGIVYASTSGSTRAVANIIADALPAGADMFDLSDWPEQEFAFARTEFDLVFLGTPTYGEGDWHYLWQRHGSRVAAVLPAFGKVGLFALGDQRGHRRSFAGGLLPLSRLARDFGMRCVGRSGRARFTFEHAPALERDEFPGLVIDYKREHRQARQVIDNWLVGFLPAVPETGMAGWARSRQAKRVG
jgi:flavodoxin I